MKTRDENWLRLERQRDKARVLLRDLAPVIVADQAVKAGFDPYGQEGRVICEILCARHDAQPHRPLLPEVGPGEVMAVADVLGFAPTLPRQPLGESDG